MDSVPLEFSERVLATRSGCSGSSPRFGAQMWNQQTQQMRLLFSIAVSGGKWTYKFYNYHSKETLSLDGVMKLKNVRISHCTFWGRSSFKHDVVDMEKLLNVVSFLSNEPFLNIYQSEDDFGCSQGKKVFKWLTESWFSYVYVPDLTPVRCQIIENQFSRWKPTKIEVKKVQENAEFLENRLMSGDLRRFLLYEPYKFPSAVLVRIIQNVLEAPEDYRRYGLDIYICFDDSVKALMNEMTESGRCRREARDGQNYKYIFDDQAPVLKVENLCEHRWRLQCGLNC